MTEQHTIDGIPLAQCTQEALYREYMAGMELEAREGLTPQQEARVLAIEPLLKDCPDAEGASPK